MSRPNSLSAKQQTQVIALFERGFGDRAAASKLGVKRWPVKRIYLRWKVHGESAIVPKATKQSFSYETKFEVVSRVLAGEPHLDLVAEFKLSSVDLLRAWVRAFKTDGEEGLRPKPKGRPKGSDVPSDDDEVGRLRREIELLRARNAYLEKLKALRTDQ